MNANFNFFLMWLVLQMSVLVKIYFKRVQLEQSYLNLSDFPVTKIEAYFFELKSTSRLIHTSKLHPPSLKSSWQSELRSIIELDTNAWYCSMTFSCPYCNISIRFVINRLRVLYIHFFEVNTICGTRRQFELDWILFIPLRSLLCLNSRSKWIGDQISNFSKKSQSITRADNQDQTKIDTRLQS